MASVVPITAAIDPLKELQKDFCLFKLSGQMRVGDRQEIADILAGKRDVTASMYSATDGKVLMKRCLEGLPVSSNLKATVEQFMNSPATFVYDAVAFSPLATPPTTLNYWQGSPVQPAAGDWSIIRDFLHHNICDGNNQHCAYLIQFLAHMLQKPEEKPEIMIVLLGGQGTGKGTFFRLLQAIWPRTTLQVSDIDHVTGRFNAAIERNFAICMDEALFRGDRKATDHLKSFITEPTVTIEQKYQPMRTIDSFHRFFAASNQKHFAQLDPDDRRFVILRVSDVWAGDHAYWSDLHAAINDPDVIAAMVHDLEGLSLTSFNVRARPKTAAHMAQKLASLTGFNRYWFEVLQTTDLNPCGIYVQPDLWLAPRFVSTKTLLEGWGAYEKGLRKYAGRQQRDVHDAIRELCPSAKYGRVMVRGRQERGYNLPSVRVARTEFAITMGGKIKWRP